MIKKVITTQKITINHKYCDDCETEIRIGMACNIAICEKCGKDLCDKCIGHEDYTTGDYRIVYCKNCWTIGEPYLQKIKILEDEIEKLYDEWNNECKK